MELSGWQGKKIKQKAILGVFVLDVAQACRYDTVSQRWPCLCSSIKGLEWNTAPPREGSDPSLQFRGSRKCLLLRGGPGESFCIFWDLCPSERKPGQG